MYNNKANNGSVLTDGNMKYIKTDVSTENGNSVPVQKMPSLESICLGGSGKIRQITSLVILVE